MREIRKFYCLIAVLLSLLCLATPACAGFDQTTKWLNTQPMTLLDWAMFNGTQRLNALLVRPGFENQAFASMMRMVRMKPETASAYMTVSIEKRVVSIYFAIDSAAPKPSSGDCVNVLERVRDTLLITGGNGARSLDLSSEKVRARAAAGFMDQISTSASEMPQPSRPVEVGRDLADATTIKVAILGTDLAGFTSCDGSLAGVDFKQGTP